MDSRIHIVEDNVYVREAMGEMIEVAEGLEVCGSSSSGEEALEVLTDLEVSLVLIDLSLPRMSGLELLEALRDNFPDLLGLIYSGHAEAEYARRALERGSRGYVLKGDPGELITAIERILAGETYVSPRLELRP
ncbi:MAG: response regulator [Persicimonas sp.]